MEPIQLTKDGRVKLPQPDEVSRKEKDDAMGSYLMMFAAWAIGLPLPFVNLIASLIYYLINKKESRFTCFHAYQSLITQAVISIFNSILIFWTIRNLIFSVEKNNNLFNQYFFVYLIFVIIWNILYTVYSLIACVKAYKGNFFYMLFFGRIAFNKFYGKKAQLEQNKISKNIPPSGF